MQIHPIKTKWDHKTAIARIEELMGAAPNSPEGDELDILATLVDAYEAKRHEIDAPCPIAAIQFRMEQQHLSRKDLEPFIGSRARVSEILAGKRNLTLDMVRKLREGLGISADLLIEPSSALTNRYRRSTFRTGRSLKPNRAKATAAFAAKKRSRAAS
jgi:HTH-type transcriptional regulator/antitoxin HigA